MALSQKLMEDNKKLQARVKNLDTGYVAEYGTRINSQAEQAKKLYTKKPTKPVMLQKWQKLNKLWLL